MVHRILSEINDDDDDDDDDVTNGRPQA